MRSPLISLTALIASVVSVSAFAASNMENPLYMPKNKEIYLKVGTAFMYKKADSTEATRQKNMDGDIENPVWRFTGDIGYGITDRLDVHGHFGYTHDEDIFREGMHRGRIGLMYRALTEEKPLVLDLYADAYLSGISPMKGTYTDHGFDFDNYSNGRYGIIAGTRFGKTWDKFTLAAHVEYLQTFGNHNNEIDIGIPTYANLLGTNEISVNLKSTHETVAGFDAMYELNSKWSFGGGFEYIEHSDNGVKSIHTKLKKLQEPYNTQQKMLVDALLAETKDMKDGWDEYVLKANVAYGISDSMQIVMFAEYTFDDSHSGSQNGTDIKAEAGLRFNARF